MRKTVGPARIVVLEVDPGRGFSVYRIVRSEYLDDPVFLNSLRSNYELDHPPRGVERSSTVIHMGVSAYISEYLAQQTAQRWEKLGDYIAEVQLAPGRGFNFAYTGHPQHLTIWADPVKLREAVVGIRPA
ncbi:MAG: hypothetical protein JO153_07435 [Solirubrobacterales bacterium]|nr:hypothetical protein [Solirubrobacterales bacterium]